MRASAAELKCGKSFSPGDMRDFCTRGLSSLCGTEEVEEGDGPARELGLEESPMAWPAVLFLLKSRCCGFIA